MVSEFFMKSASFSLFNIPCDSASNIWEIDALSPRRKFLYPFVVLFCKSVSVIFIVWNFPCSLKLIGDKRFKKRLQKFVCVTGVWILSWVLSKYLEWLQGLLLYAYTLMWHCFKLHKTWCFPHPLHFCLTAY